MGVAAESDAHAHNPLHIKGYHLFRRTKNLGLNARTFDQVDTLEGICPGVLNDEFSSSCLRQAWTFVGTMPVPGSGRYIHKDHGTGMWHR